LKTDRRIAGLFAQCFNCGGGPFAWGAIRHELKEVAAGIAERHPGFGTRAELEQSLDALLAALEEARAGYPGIERRGVYLDKTQWDIQERLTLELTNRGREGAAELVGQLVFGCAALTSPGVETPVGDAVRVVPVEVVKQGAAVLREITSESLFDPDSEDFLEEDYRHWRDMYLAAAEHREAILVGD
jgi:hypothetical protein